MTEENEETKVTDDTIESMESIQALEDEKGEEKAYLNEVYPVQWNLSESCDPDQDDAVYISNRSSSAKIEVSSDPEPKYVCTDDCMEVASFEDFKDATDFMQKYLKEEYDNQWK